MFSLFKPHIVHILITRHLTHFVSFSSALSCRF